MPVGGQKPKYRRLNLTSALLSKADFRTVFLSSCLAQSSDNVQLSKPTNSLRTRGQSSISFEKRNPLLWPRIWFFGGARGIARHVDLNAIAISGAAGADPVRIIGKSVPRRAPANALIPNIICAFNRCRAGPLLCEDACIGPFLSFFYRRYLLHPLPKPRVALRHSTGVVAAG